MIFSELEHLVSIKTGRLDANRADEDGKYPFFTCAVEQSWINCFAFDGESVIVAGNGDLNVKYYNGKFNAYQRTYVIQNKAIERLSLRYLYYFLLDYVNTLRTLSIGGVIKYIKLSYLTKAKIPLPPLKIQEKIAAILDKADELRQNDKKILEKYDQLAQSVFLEMFGDPITNRKGFKLCIIRDLVSEVKYGTSAKSEENGKYPYLRMNNITYSGYLDLSDLKYINMSEKEVVKYSVRRGDLLFNRTNSKELVGKSSVFNIDREMVIAGYLIRMRVNAAANPYYIWGYLNSKHGKLTLTSMCKNIVGMANINAQELQDIKILKAPLELQNKFAEIVYAIEIQKSITKRSLDKSEELFQSLLQKAFSGKLIQRFEF